MIDVQTVYASLTAAGFREGSDFRGVTYRQGGVVVLNVQDREIGGRMAAVIGRSSRVEQESEQYKVFVPYPTEPPSA